MHAPKRSLVPPIPLPSPETIEPEVVACVCLCESERECVCVMIFLVTRTTGLGDDGLEFIDLGLCTAESAKLEGGSKVSETATW